MAAAAVLAAAEAAWAASAEDRAGRVRTVWMDRVASADRCRRDRTVWTDRAALADRCRKARTEGAAVVLADLTAECKEKPVIG